MKHTTGNCYFDRRHFCLYTFNFSGINNLFTPDVDTGMLCCNTFIQLANSIRIENVFNFVRVPVEMLQYSKWNLIFIFLSWGTSSEGTEGGPGTNPYMCVKRKESLGRQVCVSPTSSIPWVSPWAWGFFWGQSGKLGTIWEWFGFAAVSPPLDHQKAEKIDFSPHFHSTKLVVSLQRGV